MTPCQLAIFGATGDLATTKLVPSLYDLEASDMLDSSLRFVALARRPYDTEAWRAHVVEVVRQARPSTARAELLQRFASRFAYVRGDYSDAATYDALRAAVSPAYPGGCENVAFYLAVPPDDFLPIVQQLDRAGLSSAPGGHRIVIEKPFGTDLASARALNVELHRHYDEDQIYRIDHYMGKETVQNVIVFRFANSVLEPLWNRHYIDHVQITVAESEGIGTRAGYFDEAGAVRDMIQNHLLQLLTLVAMEPPASLAADDLQMEKAKVLRSVRPLDAAPLDGSAVRAQYTAGSVQGERVTGYRQEAGVPADSTTETYVALKLFVDNWRWRGVPFYLRTGKRLAAQTAMVALRFRDPPQGLFRDTACARLEPNWLLLQIQPQETILFELQARRPGLDLTPRVLRVDTAYREADEKRLDAYASLLLGVIEGDRSLFIRFDEVESAWAVVAPLLEAWSGNGEGLYRYPAGSWGPPEADRLLERPHQTWRNAP